MHVPTKSKKRYMQKCRLAAATAAIITSTLISGCGGGSGSGSGSRENMPASPEQTAPVTFIPVSVASCDTSSYQLLQLGDYSVITNTWGKGTITNFTECIDGTSIGTVINKAAIQTGVTAKWNWDWPTSGFNVKAYPEILYRPNGKGLPSIPFTEINGWTVNHDVTLSATGDYNLAYDIWVDSAATTDHWPHKAEIMIKLQQTWSDGPPIDTITVGGSPYDVIARTMVIGSESWQYFVFNSRTALPKASIPLKPFVDYLVSKNYLLQSDYISTIEFGTELIQGKGTATINSYSVTH